MPPGGLGVKSKMVKVVPALGNPTRLVVTATASKSGRTRKKSVLSAIGRLFRHLLLDGALWHQSDGHGTLPRDVGVYRGSQITRATRPPRGVRATMRVGVTLADDRQRHADEWWSVELAALTARRVSDMIAELGRRPLGRPDGPWRWRLSVGAKISYPEAAALTTSHTYTDTHTGDVPLAQWRGSRG